MKKILILLLLSWFFMFWNISLSNASCVYVEWTSLSKSLDNCLDDTALVNWWDAEIWSWFDEYIINWTKNISFYLAFFAVMSIVIGSLMLTFSSWDDEKVNKAKWVVKWWIIWFIWILSAWTIVTILIKIMYSL